MNKDFPLSTETTAFFGLRDARLVRFNGSWLTYEPGGFYRELDEELLRAEIRRACAHTLKQTAVNGVLDEVKSACVVDTHGAELPMWLVDLAGLMPDASDLIVCKNGLLDPATGTLYGHSDALLTFNALPFDYTPDAPPPALWLRFLDEVFDGDAESIAELQKLFGYLLTLDTHLQKLFAIIGPTRSGKGTIARVLGALIGPGNVCGPSFASLGGDFGLQSLIGKQLAIISDARLGHRVDKMVVAERLLSISGEDSLDVARKHRTDWHGRLNSRILILSNELPALPDPSGSLAARFVAFHTPKSFLGREDRALTKKLLGELPGVLNWSLDGLRRVRAGDEITTPHAARDIIEGIEALGSPVKAFVGECCTLTPEGSSPKDMLWGAYTIWHRANGLPGAPLSKEMFGRALKTAFPGTVKEHRPRAGDGASRQRQWLGIALSAPVFGPLHGPLPGPNEPKSTPINYINHGESNGPR